MRISDWSSDVCSSDLRHSRESGNPTPSAALRGNVARRVPAFAGMTEKKVPRGASVLRLRRLAFLGGEADEIVERRERRRRACARRDPDLLVGPRGPFPGGEDAGWRRGAARGEPTGRA